MLLAHVALAMLLLCLAFQADFQSWGLQANALVLVLSSVGLLVLVGMASPSGVWSFPFMFYLILVLFHVGLLVSPALGLGMASFLDDQWTGWYTEDLMMSTAYIIELGLLAYAAGVGLWIWLRQSAAAVVGQSNGELNPALATNLRNERLFGSSLADVGAVMMLVSVATWYALAASQMGPLFFLQSYENFRDSTSVLPLGTTYLGMSIGAMLLVQRIRRPLVLVALVPFIAFVLMALAIGIRSSALIPVIAALAVLGRRVSMPRGWLFALVLVVGLFGISVVQQVRAEGLGSVSLESVSASPLSAVEEMGYTARTVLTSIDWHENAAEPYRGGDTYWAPVERGLAVVVGAGRPDDLSDFRLMNVEIAERVGQIGGSIIAEAHHNFGRWGVVVIALLAGLTLAAAATCRPSPRNLAFGGLAMVLLLMHVRNSFTPLPSWALAGLAAIAAAYVLANLRAWHGEHRR